MSSVFGDITDAGVVEQALLNYLQGHLPQYLAELDSQRGLTRGYTSPPRSWEVVPNLDLSDEPQYPAIKIVSMGPNEPFTKDGEGNVRGTYEFLVVAFVVGPDESATRTLRGRYMGAIMATLAQRRSLGNPQVRGLDFIGGDHFDLPADERRTKQAGSMRITIEWDHMMNWKAGPDKPGLPGEPYPWPTDPPTDPDAPVPPWTTVETIIVDIPRTDDQEGTP